MKKYICIGLGLCCSLMMFSQTTITRDTIQLSEDTIAVIETACSPICSSIVRVYNQNWLFLTTIPHPFEHAIFPEAYIDGGRIYWRDNTDALLDEEEKQYLRLKDR